MLRKVEKYEVEDEIGHGGMATVYRARDTKLDRLVALKIMHPHLRGAAEARARFRREAQSVARLKHARVLEIYDYSGEESDESYIAAELLTGPTLRKWTDEHAPIPAEIAACFAIEVCRALAAAHDKGIVHRDVKPENILLHENRELKLTDFGIADMVDSASMTATGQILGSPGHMAPEQIEGGHSDPRTDLFALGTVLYLLTTGRLPFTGKNPHQVLKRVVDGDYADPMRFAPAMGAGMAAVIRKAMSKRAEDRYATAGDMEKALAELVTALGLGDAHDEVAKFLADPTARTKEIDALIVERSLAVGKAAKAAGRVSEAQDHLGRVLALDDGNAEALALLANIGSQRDRATMGRRAGIGAAVLVGALALVAGISRIGGLGDSVDHGTPDGGVLVVVADLDDASVGDVGAGQDAAGGDRDAFVGDDAGVDAAVAVVPIGIHHAPLTPRHVIFDPDPVNVRIRVDDDPERPYGPAFHDDVLAPGRHTFTFISNADCCADVTFETEIPAGPGDTTIARTLPSADATLYVVANVPAAVAVDHGRVRGPTRYAIFVPITAASRAETVSFAVTADGYAPFEDEVDLAAGVTTRVSVTLSPLP
jgi:tRNA A-37 threonylcarbamoyl transferase component Bud32